MHPYIVVDASVWASRLMAQDANHVASRIWADRYYAKGGLLIAPEYMLIEIAAVLTRQTKRPQVVKRRVRSLYSYIPMQIEPVDAALVQKAIDVATELRLKAGDAVYVALAARMTVPLISWDNEQLGVLQT